MQVVNQPITGQEVRSGVASPHAALVNFYHAFNNRNFELMQANWLPGEEASMSNPLGGVRRGWDDIKQTYKKIFTGEARVYVEFYDYSLHISEDMFIAVGRERGALDIDGKKIELAIRTSRTYVLYSKQWQQIHHHGSMDNPELLASYQNTLIRK